MPLNCLRARRRDIVNLLHHAGKLGGLSREGKKRLTWFAYALAHEGNVSLTCRYFGISRSTFMRWASRFDPKRPETLDDHSRRPHRVRPPEVTPAVVTIIRRYRTEFPTMGKEKIAQKLHSEHALTVSASTVGRVIARERLFFGDRPSHQQKRTGTDFAADASAVAPSSPASSVSVPETGEADAWPAPQLPLFGS